MHKSIVMSSGRPGNGTIQQYRSHKQEYVVHVK